MKSWRRDQIDSEWTDRGSLWRSVDGTLEPTTTGERPASKEGSGQGRGRQWDREHGGGEGDLRRDPRERAD